MRATAVAGQQAAIAIRASAALTVHTLILFHRGAFLRGPAVGSQNLTPASGFGQGKSDNICHPLAEVDSRTKPPPGPPAFRHRIPAQENPTIFATPADGWQPHGTATGPRLPLIGLCQENPTIFATPLRMVDRTKTASGPGDPASDSARRPKGSVGGGRGGECPLL